MKTQNKVQLIGYLGADPVIVALAKGGYKAELCLATDYYRKKDNNILQHKVTWHNVIIWHIEPESITNQYMKGSHVLVEGEIIYRSFTDKAGLHRTIAEIRARQLMNLDR